MRSRARLEHVLIVTLSTPRFAESRGRPLAELLALPSVDSVALMRSSRRPFATAGSAAGAAAPGTASARAPGPPPVSRLLRRRPHPRHRWLPRPPRPVSGEHDQLTQIGRKPACTGAAEFRSCVYQPTADFVIDRSDQLSARLQSFTSPPSVPSPSTEASPPRRPAPGSHGPCCGLGPGVVFGEGHHEVSLPLRRRAPRSSTRTATAAAAPPPRSADSRTPTSKICARRWFRSPRTSPTNRPGPARPGA